jgi:hypothetical protein
LISSLADLEGLSAVTGYWASGVYLPLTQDIDASNTSTWNVGDHDNEGVTAEVPMGFLPIGDFNHSLQRGVGWRWPCHLQFVYSTPLGIQTWASLGW